MLRRPWLDYPLSGRTLFITGGASGIGAEDRSPSGREGRATRAGRRRRRRRAERLAVSSPSAIGIDGRRARLRLARGRRRSRRSRSSAASTSRSRTPASRSRTPRAACRSIEMERIADINFTGVFRTVRATLPARDRPPRLPADHGVARRDPARAAAQRTTPRRKAGVEAFGNAAPASRSAHKGVDVGVAYFGVHRHADGRRAASPTRSSLRSGERTTAAHRTSSARPTRSAAPARRSSRAWRAAAAASCTRARSARCTRCGR